MRVSNKSNKAAYVSILTAISASLCCITPILAVIAGSAGITNIFSWMEPFRPYLIAITIVILGFAWYQRLKNKTNGEVACECDENKNLSFWQSKRFLLIITVFSALMVAFPYYSNVFYNNPGKEILVESEKNVVNKIFDVKGMTCPGCEANVESKVNKLNGIISVKASYEKSNTKIQFDTTKVTESKIIEAIDKTGYKVVPGNQNN